MPLRAPTPPPIDQRQWDQWTRSVPVIPDDGSVQTVTVADKAITNVKLRDSAPTSIIGRLISTAGSPGDITATVDNTFLARRAGVLGWGILADADIPTTIARDAAVTSAIATALTPYITQANADASYVSLANVLNGSKTYDPPSLTTGTQATTTITVTGLVPGDYVQASFSLDLQGMILTAYCSVANTATAVMLNMTGGTVDLASGTLKCRGWKQ